MAEHDDLGFDESTLDRRSLLEKAALAGGTIAMGGLLSDRALGALTQNPGNVTF